MSACLDAALHYLGLGLSVIPVEPRGKTPLVPWTEFQRRLPTEEEVREWWRAWPEANIGVVTGAISGVIVLDVDGPDGQQALRKCAPVPVTWRSRTGKSDAHEHLWFRHPGRAVRNFAKRRPGLDLRGDGGQVVLPPSIHASGRQYEWLLAPWDADLAAPPPWLLDLLHSPADDGGGRRSQEEWFELLQGAPEGQRHEVAAQIAGHFLALGYPPAAVEAMLVGYAVRCRPPFDIEEARRIVEDLAAKEQAKRKKSSKDGGGGRGNEPGQKDTRQGTPADFHLTDLGNAQRLVRDRGRDLHYCPELGGWLVWDGARWKKDATAEVMRRAKDTVAQMYHSEAPALADEKERVATAKWAIQSEADRHLVAMLHLAESEPGVPVTPDEIDRDPWALNVLNGTLDLRTGELRPHRREDLLTKLVPVAYDSAAEYPLWDRVLERVLPEPELRRFLQKAIGYALTGETREQVLFILWGTGSNGKTTFLRTLSDLLADYACQTPGDTLLVRRGDSPPNDVARLRGMRLVAAIEAEGGRRLAEALVKQMTGGDRLAARFLYREFFEFVPTFKLFLAVNHKPEIRGTDHAIWRRVRLIPFTITIPDEEQDKTLRDKLVAQLPGILNWAVQGCLLWQREGLAPPEQVKEATASYREELDVFGRFLSECCEVDPDGKETAKALYERYLTWCHQAGEKKPVSQKRFGMLLEERGFRSVKSDKARFWTGLRLLPKWVSNDQGG